MDIREIARATSSRWKLLPKVELHIHLEDTIRLSTLLEECRNQDIALPFSAAEDLADYFQLQTPAKNLKEFLDILDRHGIILKDKKTISRIAKEAVEDKCEEGVKLLELRYPPSGIRFMSNSSLSFEEIHEAVKTGISQGIREGAAKGHEICVGLICSAVPTLGKEEFQQTVDLALKFRHEFIGFDVSGGDDVNLMDFQNQLDAINDAGLRIIIHAGEEYSKNSHRNMKNAIQKLHAIRIGHGIQALESDDLKKLVKDANVHLEICPLGEYFSACVKNFVQHPVRNLMETSMNVNASLSTSNPSAMKIDLNVLYEILHREFGFDSKDFFNLNRNALNASFLPHSEKEKIHQKYFSSAAEDNCKLFSQFETAKNRL